MIQPSPSSRQQFEQYKAGFRRAQRCGTRRAEHDAGTLVVGAIRSFLGLLHGHRGSVALSLATLTVSTLLALIPPAATKFVVDYVLGGRPLPATVPGWVPREPWPLLLCITGGVVVVSLTKIGVHVWGRWHATRVSKLLQMSVRKKVFAHVVRLPLHRVQELKSGGAASVLRQDAGSVGELVFGMLYNPCQAVIQLLGSFCILAWVDWRLLLGALLLIPVVFAPIGRGSAAFGPSIAGRDLREKVDALTTESFGGMRVVRAFGRQRTETNRILRGNHVMGRQELYAWWWTRAIEIVWDTIIPLASAALLLYGGWRVLEGKLTLGDLMMFLVYLLMLLGPLAVLAQSAAQFQNSLSSLDRVLDLLGEPREMESAAAVTIHGSSVAGRLSIENVWFRYPGTELHALQESRSTSSPVR